jgi:hypothetical protein
MKNYFGVAAGAKAVAVGFQQGAQVKKVVQLAVVDDATAFVFVPDRLAPAGQVNNAQAANAQ